MEMPWAMRKALVSRIHKIDTGILTGCAGMHNFDQLFGLCSRPKVQQNCQSFDRILFATAYFLPSVFLSAHYSSFYFPFCFLFNISKKIQSIQQKNIFSFKKLAFFI